VNPQEAYKLEGDYWRLVGDERRAELADEIRARLEKQTGGQQPVADPAAGKIGPTPV
jgi:hypothetical protein